MADYTIPLIFYQMLYRIMGLPKIYKIMDMPLIIVATNDYRYRTVVRLFTASIGYNTCLNLSNMEVTFWDVVAR